MLGLPGEVVGGSGPDSGVAAHLGQPALEQRRLEQGRGFVELPFAVVAVTGSARLTWLDTLSSQRVRELAPGVGAELLLLDVHGRIEHQAWLLDTGETALLVLERASVPGLVGYLDRMRFMLDVAVTAREELAVLGLVAPAGLAASPVVAGLREVLGSDVEVLADPWPGVVDGGSSYSRTTDHPGAATPFALAVLPAERVDDAVAHLVSAGLQPAGMLAWEALRVAAWRPRAAREIDDKSLPHELDLLRTAVHLNKGCYRGQEGVARTFNLGRPPRRLVLLHLDGSDHLLPELGADVGHDGRRVGRITSAVRHHELGPIALAVLKRSVPEDAQLEVAGPAGAIAASQEVVVPVDGLGQGRPEARGPVTPGLRRRP